MRCLRQGLGYSGDSAAKVLPKFCTPNGSPKKFSLCTIKFSCFQAFQPCMTLWVQNWTKYQKKNIFSKKSPINNDFCVTPFPITSVCQSITNIWPLTTLLLRLCIVFSWFLALKWAIMKPVEVGNEGFMSNFVKSVNGQQKNSY